MRHSKIFLSFLLGAIWAPFALAGLYASGGGGVTEGTLRYSQDQSLKTETHSQVNGMGQIGLGWAQNWNAFSAGIEIGAEWQGFDASKTVIVKSPLHGSTGIVSTALQNDYYIQVKPGYVIKDLFIVYGLIGVLRGELEYSDSTGDIGNRPGTTYQETKTGYRVGLGLANHVKEHWEWRVEYTYNGYGKIHSSIVDYNSGELLHITRSNIAINQVLLGIGYYF